MNIRLKDSIDVLIQNKSESDDQRKMIIKLENKLKENSDKFNDLWSQNVKDIKSKKDTLPRSSRNSYQ